MPGRSYNSNSYKYGYQGSEKDDELSGSGNDYTTFYRCLDTRLGRWMSIDPKLNAFESPYVSMANNPILYNDPLGDKIHANFKTWIKLINAALADREIRQRLWAQQTDTREVEHVTKHTDGSETTKTVKESQDYHYIYNPNSESTLSDALDKTEAKRQSKEDNNRPIMGDYYAASFNTNKSEDISGMGQGKGGEGNDGTGRFDSKPKTIKTDGSYQYGSVDLSFSPNQSDADPDGDKVEIFKGKNKIYEGILKTNPDVPGGYSPINVTFDKSDGKRAPIKIRISDSDGKSKPGAYHVKGTVSGF